MKILLVEDNQDFAEGLVLFLKGRGHEVNHQTLVKDAIAAFDTNRFDAVITDIHLTAEGDETSSGLELIRHIRKKRESSVVISVTTGLDLIEEEPLRKRGVDLFHHKPITIGFNRYLIELESLVQKRAQG